MAGIAIFIERAEQFFVPHRKRLSCSYVVNDEGARELRIDYGTKEVTFDDERFFAFGEQLAGASTFTGEQATAWGPGYAWDELRPMLEALLEEGILARGNGSDDPRGGGLVPSPLAPSACPVARMWSAAECESITRDLAGRAVEIGHLEAIVPVYRIAHPALDGDGRQIGEANVFPSPLRLDRETEWRVCQYAGSRYRDAAPMNVTALKAMIKHWKPILAMTLAVRAALRERFAASCGPWTIGELHAMACVVLALPAFQLEKRGGGSPQPPVHPVLSSLFRITDGIRMTTHEMMFSLDDARDADEPTTAAEVHARAEQRGLLLSATGVCAGPKHLIDEFLATAVDGAAPDGIAALELPAALTELLAALPAALDYGLYGLQIWGLVHSTWLAMSQAYRALIAILDSADAAESTTAAQLRARLAADWALLEQVELARDHDREVHARGYRHTYETAWAAGRAPIGPSKLAQALTPYRETEMHHAAAASLTEQLHARLFPGEAGARPAERIARSLVGYLCEEQAILATIGQLQQAINALLDRPAPARPLEARDLRIYFAIRLGAAQFPYLLEAFDEIGIHVACTAHAIDTRYAGNSAGGQ